MGYSTKEMHIDIFQASNVNNAFKDNFTPLAESSFQRFLSATDKALEFGMSDDITLIATFCSDMYLPTDKFDSLISFLQTHEDVKRITGMNPACVTILTQSSFVVTILLVGATKFMETKVANVAKTEDDSFEDVEDLTQRVNTILKAATPRK
jgi:hypothetical protein